MAVIVESRRSVGRPASSLRHYAVTVRDRALEGGLWSLVAYLVATGLLFTFVLASVNGHSGVRLAEAALSTRTMSWLENWYTYGFWKYAGLLIYESDGLTVYKSHSWFYLVPLYAIEMVIRAAIGRFSYRAPALFNQSVIWIGGALVGWLAMRLTKHLPRYQAFLLGLACAAVYQTFPLNLMN